MDLHMPLGEALLRLLAAAVLGAVLGAEREAREKPAGLRTHMMVCLGACAFSLLGYEVYETARRQLTQPAIDPSRILEGLIGGIGFLGAGSILRERGSVEGLTTAAGIWVAGAIGGAVGFGYYTIALAVTVLAFVILVLLGLAERKLLKTKPDPAKD